MSVRDFAAKQVRKVAAWACEVTRAYRDLILGRGQFGDYDPLSHEAEPSDDPHYCVQCRHRITKDFASMRWVHL